MLHVKKADIVIIGGGAAGTMAALHARRVNPDLKIVILDKSRIETSGGAGRGMDAINTILLPPYSGPEDFVAMQTKITEGVLDQEVCLFQEVLDPGFRRGDEYEDFLRMHQCSMINVQ